MFVIIVSFALSVYFSEDVVKNRVSEVHLGQMFLDKKEPKRRKNKSPNHINRVMNSGNS
jgi:hypothetical protein